MLSPREKALLDLDDALEGFKQIHVWRGKPSPWMHTVAIGFGEPIDDPEQELKKANLTQEFIESTEMYYDGIMPLDEVKQRLDTLRSYTES